LLSAGFRRREDLSCRPFDQAQDKLRPASIFGFVERLKKTWIPACAAMTKGRVDYQSTNLEPPRLEAEGHHKEEISGPHVPMEASVSASELTFGKIAASTGTGGFIIFHDYLT